MQHAAPGRNQMKNFLKKKVKSKSVTN